MRAAFRTASNLSARALRRAKAHGLGARANVRSAMGFDPAQRLASILSRHAAMSTVTAASSVANTLKTESSTGTQEGLGSLLCVLDEVDDEESHRCVIDKEVSAIDG
ncbi:hypothetical protein DFS34DRAFT_683139 [Phlyctochytrium arcticum]|nr:hypothetical protein DFS34DRAFT_683139 [Phlyctochytrium arcticum]